MTRKGWSNAFLFVAALNFVLGITPSNHFRLVDWGLMFLSLFLGVVARRKMI